MASPYRERLIAAKAAVPELASYLPRRIPTPWNWMAWTLAVLLVAYFVTLLVDLITHSPTWYFSALSATLMLVSLYGTVRTRTGARRSGLHLLDTVEKIAEHNKKYGKEEDG